MKKHYALLASALMLAVTGFSQERTMPYDDEAKLSEADFIPMKSTIKTPKVYGDTMAYFDFNGGLPAGWLVYENANTGFNWTWSQSAPRGQFTSAPAIASTTGSNGFMLLESDYYNTPIPPGGAVGMDAYFQSGPIPIQSLGSVLLRFQQSFRYCCNPSNALDVEIRSDVDTTWVKYTAKNGTAVNNATPNPMFTEINISNVAANVDTIYLRFHQGVASHYYWMVDDIAIVEGPDHNLDLQDYRVTYEEFGAPRKQFYTQVPLAMFDTMFFSATISNQGGMLDSGHVTYQVSQDLNCFGAPGVGTIAYVQDDLPVMNPMDTIDVNFSDPFLPPAKGQYTITTSVQSANTDQVPANNVLSNTFSVVDTVYAKDDGNREGTVAPHDYVGFDHDGASLFLYFEMPNPQVVTSLSYFPAGSRSIGATFAPQVWGFDTTVAGCNIYETGWAITAACLSPSPIVQYPIPILIDSQNVETWVTVPVAPTLLNQYPAYLVGYEAGGYVHGGTNNNVTVGAEMGDDMDAIRGAFDGTGFYDFNTIISNAAKDDFVDLAAGTPMIRMNFGQLSDTCFLVGVDEEAAMRSAFEIYPNPNNGEFNVKIATEMSKDYTLTVTNMLGQNVYTEMISVNNEEINRNMDFTNLEKGIYFVTLQNNTERQTQKIVIR